MLRERVLGYSGGGRAQALQTRGERRRVRRAPHSWAWPRAAARPAHPSDRRPSGAPGRDPRPRACRPARSARARSREFRGQFVARRRMSAALSGSARLQLRQVEDAALSWAGSVSRPSRMRSRASCGEAVALGLRRPSAARRLRSRWKALISAAFMPAARASFEPAIRFGGVLRQRRLARLAQVRGAQVVLRRAGWPGSQARSRGAGACSSWRCRRPGPISLPSRMRSSTSPGETLTLASSAAGDVGAPLGELLGR